MKKDNGNDEITDKKIVLQIFFPPLVFGHKKFPCPITFANPVNF